MPSVLIDTDFVHHPAIKGAGLVVCLMFVSGLCYCSRHRGGPLVIPECEIAGLVLDASPEEIKRDLDHLVATGIWEKVDGGYAPTQKIAWKFDTGEKRGDH
jgi:hypothetical protein